jgi:hypothetical protein
MKNSLSLSTAYQSARLTVVLPQRPRTGNVKCYLFSGDLQSNADGRVRCVDLNSNEGAGQTGADTCSGSAPMHPLD